MNQKENSLYSPVIRLMCWLAATTFTLLESQPMLRMFQTGLTRIPYRVGLEVLMLAFLAYFLPKKSITQRMIDLTLLALSYKLLFLCSAFFSESAYLWIYTNAERPVMCCFFILMTLSLSWPDRFSFPAVGVYSYRFGDRFGWSSLIVPVAVVIGLRADSLPPQWWLIVTAIGGGTR